MQQIQLQKEIEEVKKDELSDSDPNDYLEDKHNNNNDEIIEHKFLQISLQVKSTSNELPNIIDKFYDYEESNRIQEAQWFLCMDENLKETTKQIKINRYSYYIKEFILKKNDKDTLESKVSEYQILKTNYWKDFDEFNEKNQEEIDQIEAKFKDDEKKILKQLQHIVALAFFRYMLFYHSKKEFEYFNAVTEVVFAGHDKKIGLLNYDKKSNIKKLEQIISSLRKAKKFSINLESNGITCKDIQGLIQNGFNSTIQLAHKCHLQEVVLKLSFNPQIGDLGAEYLSQAFSRWERLQDINLRLNNCNIQEHGCIELSKGLAKWTKLERCKLSLGNNNLYSAQFIHIAQAFEHWHCLTNFSQLGLEFNFLDDISILQLSLASKFWKQDKTDHHHGKGLKELNLQLFKNLIKQHNLATNDKKTSTCMYISQIYTYHCAFLLHNTLSLSYNEIGDNGLLQLCEGLKQLVHLENSQLFLNQTLISNNKILELKDTMKCWVKIKYIVLFIEGNSIDPDKVKELKEAIETAILVVFKNDPNVEQKYQFKA